MAFCGVLDWSPCTQHYVKRFLAPFAVLQYAASLSIVNDRLCVVKSHILLEVTLLICLGID